MADPSRPAGWGAPVRSNGASNRRTAAPWEPATECSTSGTRCSRGEAPILVKNVVAAATVTKNSAVLTESPARRGACPEPVEVVICPQPPPPLASKNPATNPSGAVHPASFRGAGYPRPASMSTSTDWISSELREIAPTLRRQGNRTELSVSQSVGHAQPCSSRTPRTEWFANHGKARLFQP